MTSPIVTPLTQALAEGKLSREELKQFMRRSDGPALRRLVLWVGLLAATAASTALAWNSWLIWPAMLLHGTVLAHHFALQHECVHYTAFRTRWVNDLVGQLCGIVIMLPHRFFRYEHCDHHTHTQHHDKDPEMIAMPGTFGEYIWYLSAVPYWRSKFAEIFRHATGRLSEAERKFVPRAERKAVFSDARRMLAIYAAMFLGMAMTGWWNLLWFWIVPLFLGEPVMRFVRMAEHVGRPAVAQMSENTRTNLVSAPWRFLCWNMNYHAEHHYVASVPFHALPRLHEKLKEHVHVERNGYLGAHRDILRQIIRRAPAAAADQA